MQNIASATINLLVALSASTHGQSSIHVNVVARQIQTDQALEDNAPSWEGGCKKYQQTGRSTSVCDHIQHCAESGRLVISSCSETIESIQ